MADEQQSPALNYMTPQGRGLSARDAYEKLAAESGADPKAVDAKIQGEHVASMKDTYLQAVKTTQAAAKAGPVNRDNIAMGEVVNTAYDVAEGIGSGFRKIGQNIYNGVVSVADGVENYAASKGIGSGNLISDANKWDDATGTAIAASANPTAKITKAVTEFTAPLMAVIGSGGGTLLATGVNAAYNFLAIDPKEAKLADHLKGTFLHEIPLASSVIDGLSTKPNETEMEGRIKNVAMGLGLDAAAAGLIYGASGVYSKIAQLRSGKVLAEANQVIDGTATAAAHEPVPAQAVDGMPAVHNADPNITAAADAGVPSASTSTPLPAEVGTAQEAQHLAQFEKDLATTEIGQPTIHAAEDGTPRIRLNSDAAIEHFYEMSKSVDQDLLRKPMTDAELLSVGKDLASDPATIEKIAKWTPGTVLNDKETIALKYLMSDADRAFQESSAAVANKLDDPTLQAKYTRDVERYFRMTEIRTGTASEKGATLRSEQVIAAGLGLSEREAMATIGAQGRAKLVNGIVDAYGGSDKIVKIARNVNILKEIADASQTPNEVFATHMADVSKRAAWMPLDDAITKVAMNGMLSSPMTATKAIFSNAIMSATTTLENYVEVGIGMVARNGNRKTITEANAHLAGLLEGFSEAWRPSARVLLKGETPRIVRQELQEAAVETLDQNDVAFKAMGAQMETTGQISDIAMAAAKDVTPKTLGQKVGGAITDTLALRGYPVRVLMAVDTFFNHANTKAFLSAESAKYAQRLGKAGVGAEEAGQLLTHFENNMPAPILQAADEFAKSTTFAKELSGFPDLINKALSGANQKIPLARIVVPFFKTNANMVEEVIERSALAPLISADFKSAWAAGGRAQDQALAKVMTGSTVLGVFSYMASKGVLNGSNTLNPEIERALKDNKTVAPPTSIKVGDQWVSIKGIDPLATMVDAAHFISKASGYLSEEEYQHAATTMAMAVGTMALPESITSAMADVIDISQGGRGWEDKLANMATRFTPAGGALTDIRQTVDPKLRQSSLGSIQNFKDFVDTVKMKYQNQIPYMSKDLPAQRNLWAEVLTMPDGIGPDAITPFAATDDKGMKLKQTLENMQDYFHANKDNVDGFISDLDVKIPDRYVKNPMAAGANIQYRLEPKEFGAYQMLRAGIDPATGKALGTSGTLKEVFYRVLNENGMFNRRVQDIDPMTYKRAVAELSAHLGVYKEIADKAILNFGDVAEKMTKQAEQGRSIINKPTMGGVADVIK